jgi:CBS domain-containing protein
MRVDTCRDCERLMAIADDAVHCTPPPGALSPVGAPAGSDVSVGEAMGCAAFLVDAELPAADFARALDMPGHRVAVVVDEARRALGLVEVAVAAAALDGTTVQDLVRQVLVIHEGEPLARAIDRMVHERVRALPVVDDQDRVVGLLTDLDALHWVAHRDPRREEP